MPTISEPRIPYAANEQYRDTVEQLELGGEFIHCGEPMQNVGAEVRSTRTPMTTDESDANRAFEVYLQTRVLRCGCGFQMEIPD